MVRTRPPAARNSRGLRTCGLVTMWSITTPGSGGPAMGQVRDQPGQGRGPGVDEGAAGAEPVRAAGQHLAELGVVAAWH